MGLFDYNFDNSFLDLSAVDILEQTIIKTLKEISPLNNQVNLTQFTVDKQSDNLYISGNENSIINLKKNVDNINECPIFLISLYMFYNYHSLFDDEADISLGFWLKKGYQMIEMDFIQDDATIIPELKKHNFDIDPVPQTSANSDSPRLEIDIFEDEVEADEILFPWISFFKETFGDSFETNKQIYTIEFKVFENLINLSKSLLKDLIYLKVIEADSSKNVNKPGIKSFLDRFDSFYNNEFIEKLVEHNTMKLKSLKLIDLSVPVTNNNSNASVPKSTTSHPLDVLLIGENEEDVDKTNNAANKSPNYSEISTFLAKNQQVQEALLQEVQLLRNNMNQEFQNIKFQYNLQQQHLIKLEQQIQMFVIENTSNNGSIKQETERRNSFSNPVNLSNIQNSNHPNGNFLINTKLSPFINNSSGINQMLNTNGNNNNTTLQLLKNANYQNQGLTPNNFQLGNGLKSNINSPGGLALLNKIASPQPPLNSGMISSMIPNSTNSMYMNEGLSHNLKSKNSTGTGLRRNTLTNGFGSMGNNDNEVSVEKLPSLVESMKMQPTFSEIISDLSNPTPTSGRSTAKPESSGMKRKLVKNKVLEPRLPSVSQAITMTRNEDVNEKKIKKVEAPPPPAKKVKKSVANKNIKYRVFRGHKTIFDLCEEWYEGIPKIKVLESQNKNGDEIENGENDDVPMFKINGLDNYDNTKLFHVIKKDDSDARIEEIKKEYNHTKNQVERLESIKSLIQNYGWRKWKVTGDSHFFPKRRVVVDFIEEELKEGYKNGRFNVHVDDYNESRKVIICDLENFRLVNDLTLNNIAKLLKNVKKLSSKSIVKSEQDDGEENTNVETLPESKKLREQILLGRNNFTMYDTNDANKIWYEKDEGLKGRCVTVDGFTHIRKLEPNYIDIFCKTIIGGKI